ncbi:MAG: HisA/HisF-related TIM barrel protein, partial [bacterium]
KIRKNVSMFIEVGGGIRNNETAEKYLSIGINRVIFGTIAVENPSIIHKALEKFGNTKIAVGIDAKNGIVSVKGWTSSSNLTAVKLGKDLRKIGIGTVIYTDIDRDGMMSGPNVCATKNMAVSTGLDIIASGGISSLEDINKIKELKEYGVSGLITGRAIYENSFTVKQALDILNEP